MFLFTAEDLLVSKLYNAKLFQICTEEETNNNLACPEGESANFHFWVNCSFKLISTRVCVLDLALPLI